MSESVTYSAPSDISEVESLPASPVPKPKRKPKAATKKSTKETKAKTTKKSTKEAKTTSDTKKSSKETKAKPTKKSTKETKATSETKSSTKGSKTSKAKKSGKTTKAPAKAKTKKPPTPPPTPVVSEAEEEEEEPAVSPVSSHASPPPSPVSSRASPVASPVSSHASPIPSENDEPLSGDEASDEVDGDEPMSGDEPSDEANEEDEGTVSGDEPSDEVDADEPSLVEEEKSAAPAKRKRGRPPKGDKPVAKKASHAQKRQKPSKAEMIDTDKVYEMMEKLPKGVKARISFDQPALFTRVVNGLSDLIECPQFAILGNYLCVDSKDDDQYAIVTLRLGARVKIDEDAFEEEEVPFFTLNTKRLAAGLKNIRNFQTCSIELNETDFVHILAQNDMTSGNLTEIKLKNMDCGDYEAVGISDIHYTWHITDMDVQDFQNLVTTSSSYNATDVCFRIYEMSKDQTEFILSISTGEKEGSVCNYQHIKVKEETKEGEEVKKEEEEYDPATVFCASRDMELSQEEMRKYTSTHDPVYNHRFSARYLLSFLKATENKCIMTLHFSKDQMDTKSGKTRAFPMVLRYRLGDSSLPSYIKFVMAPVKDK